MKHIKWYIQNAFDKHEPRVHTAHAHLSAAKNGEHLSNERAVRFHTQSMYDIY